jgi:hypothetical protein
MGGLLGTVVVGVDEGCSEGSSELGATEGDFVGVSDGSFEGAMVGVENVGFRVCGLLGDPDGVPIGDPDGVPTGDTDGVPIGVLDGSFEGAIVGVENVGDLVYGFWTAKAPELSNEAA